MMIPRLFWLDPRHVYTAYAVGVLWRVSEG